MTSLQYWCGWAVALTIFWSVGFFVIRAAIISADAHIHRYR